MFVGFCLRNELDGKSAQAQQAWSEAIVGIGALSLRDVLLTAAKCHIPLRNVHAIVVVARLAFDDHKQLGVRLVIFCREATLGRCAQVRERMSFSFVQPSQTHVTSREFA